jgi:hypothetical protein
MHKEKILIYHHLIHLTINNLKNFNLIIQTYIKEVKSI